MYHVALHTEFTTFLIPAWMKAWLVFKQFCLLFLLMGMWLNRLVSNQELQEYVNI